MSRGARRLAVFALAGAAVGALWGIADNPIYEARAEVVVGTGTEDEPVSLPALLSLAESEKVARAAAANTGDDVAGADLLSAVSVAEGPDGATLVFTAISDTPDFAAAAADAYAQAMIDTQPGPLSQGAAADLPTDPIENRSATLWALLGAAAGLLLSLALSPRERPARSTNSSRRERQPTPAEAEPSALADEEGVGEGTEEPSQKDVAPQALHRPPPQQAPAPRASRRPPPSAPLARGSTTSVAFERTSFRAVNNPGSLEAPAGDFDQATRLAAEAGLLTATTSVSVAGPLRRDGRTTVALALAAAAAQAGRSAIVVEADLRHPSIAGRLGVEPTPGLADYFSGSAAASEVMRVVEAGGASAVCVPAGGGGDEQVLEPALLAGLAERLERAYDLVVFDSPAALAYPDAAMIAAATAATVVCSRHEDAAVARKLGDVLGVDPALFIEIGRVGGAPA